MNTALLEKEIRKLFEFDPELFEEFIQHMKIVKLNKEEVWEEAGKIAVFAGFVNKGILREYQIREGKEFIHQFYQEGDFIGNYISYQNQIVSEFRLCAIEDCEILRIPFVQLENLSQKHAEIARFSEYVGRKKEKEIQDRAAALLTKGPEERYRDLLEKRGEIVNRVPQYFIAQYLGVSPISLSRIRKRIFLNKG